MSPLALHARPHHIPTCYEDLSHPTVHLEPADRSADTTRAGRQRHCGFSLRPASLCSSAKPQRLWLWPVLRILSRCRRCEPWFLAATSLPLCLERPCRGFIRLMARDHIRYHSPGQEHYYHFLGLASFAVAFNACVGFKNSVDGPAKLLDVPLEFVDCYQPKIMSVYLRGLLNPFALYKP